MGAAVQVADNDRDRMEENRARYIKDAPGLTSGVRYAIERGEVVPGMRDADVKASIGSPVRSTARRQGVYRVTTGEYSERMGLPTTISIISQDGVVVGCSGGGLSGPCK
jgi:formylmethanofuran:tetrahydromethanopterin formyltransferase